MRQSISLALNKDDFVAHFINNGAKPASGLVPVGHVNEVTGKDFRKEMEIFPHMICKMRKTLGRSEKELGVEQVNLEFLTFEQDNAIRMAEYIKGDLENLQGLTIQIKQQPFKQKLQLEQIGDYDITMANWGPDYKDPISYLELFTTGNPNNKMNYSNVRYDELIKKRKRILY